MEKSRPVCSSTVQVLGIWLARLDGAVRRLGGLDQVLVKLLFKRLRVSPVNEAQGNWIGKPAPARHVLAPAARLGHIVPGQDDKVAQRVEQAEETAERG